MKKLFLLSFHFFLTLSLLAQIPAGYYDAANGKTNGELKTSLYQIIKVGKRLSYGSGSSSTWSGFEKSDLHPDGYVWDMYSNNKRYFSGNGGSVSGMNIEHSVAKSWWGGANNDAYKDLYHLNPSDAAANSARSNYPLGTNNGSRFDNGSIKVGNNTFSTDYSGLCFEPLDEYKGDFARAYMYMFTCYEDYSWTSTNAPTMIVANETWPMLKTWAKDLLVTWSRQDPVSEKERNRMAAIYKIQNNRNPYIDYPELVEFIWGSKQGQPWSATGGEYPYLSLPLSGSKINFGKVAFGKSIASTVQIKGFNLTGDLTVTLSGTNATNFSASKTTVTKAEAEAGINISVGFDAATTGSQSAALTISGGGISAVAVALSAESTDDFMALPADNITSKTFTANWTMSAQATGYILDVFTLVNNGATAPVTLFEEDFMSDLPASWTAVPYTDEVEGNIRLASNNNPGKITTPAINLSEAGNQLTVRARQYSNDAGAPLTVSVDDQTVSTLITAAVNQDFVVDLSPATAASKISLSAVVGKRVYVDYVKVYRRESVQSAVSVAGFPLSVGNMLSYTVDGLESNKTYYFTVTPEGNTALTSGQVVVQTLLNSAVDSEVLSNINFSVTDNGILLRHLTAGAKISVYTVLGRVIQQQSASSSELMIELPQKGLYLLQVENNQKTHVIKVIL
ncbi:MAG: endonuclease [Paludibacter sp.]